MKFYAVRKGRQPGIYTTWAACEEQVKGFPGAVYKAFPTKGQALAFVEERLSDSIVPPPLTSPFPTDGLATPDAVHIWVDGSCLQNGDGPLSFGWAYLVLDGQRELHRASGHDVPAEARRHRNVAGEIQAVLHALEKTTTPFTRAYAKSVRALGMALTWHKVQAHSGEEYNELVDQLAREAARSTPGNDHEV